MPGDITVRTIPAAFPSMSHICSSHPRCRCFQDLLFERKVTKSDNLSKAIDDALSSDLPTHVAEDLDAVRNVGNFAAHPQKSLRSGRVLPLEPHEAEWNLEVLEMLFDFYFVQSALSQARREALNKKLEEVGKPPMKEGR